MLARVGLAEAAARRVGTYSKGMRQRLGLAQALLGRPRALLLDEPTSGLDPALRQSFYALLREVRDAGAAVLLSSHALAELSGEVDRVVVLNRGRKMADGDIQELRRLIGIVRASASAWGRMPLPARAVAWLAGKSRVRVSRRSSARKLRFSIACAPCRTRHKR